MQHPHKIHWYEFSANSHPNAIAYCLQHPHKIDWNKFSKNPGIFTYDYSRMKKVCGIFKEELMVRFFAPLRLPLFINENNDE